MKQQRGVTLGGMMFFMLLMILAAYMAARIVPAYMDYLLVDKTLSGIATQAGLQDSSDESIRTQFAKQLRLNNITVVGRDDLMVERIPGGVHLSTAFTVKRPFFGSVSFCMDFQSDATSGK
jgi:hypothetical protein